MAARVSVRWVAADGLHEGGMADLGAARVAGPVWVDVAEADEPALHALRDAFGLHPLAIEDCLHFPQRPKLERYDGGPFLIWLTPKTLEDGRFELDQLDMFLGEGYVITSHRGASDAVTATAADAECHLRKGPEWVLHAVLDHATDAVFPMMDDIGDELDSLEDALMEKAQPDTLQRLHKAKRRLRAMHKVVGPERDALRGLEREQTFVSEDAYRYISDIGDHLARVEDSIDTYRDVAASAMDIYLSAVSNNMNEVMKRLTVIATIFMPGTLIAGIYGMNFAHPRARVAVRLRIRARVHGGHHDRRCSWASRGAAGGSARGVRSRGLSRRGSRGTCTRSPTSSRCCGCS